MIIRSPALKLRLSSRSGCSWVTIASTPISETPTPKSCRRLMRSPNSRKLAATMKAGATEPTTPMLMAVVYCRATYCIVPKAAPPMSARKVSAPILALSLPQSAISRCGPTNPRISATTSQRTTDKLAGGTSPAIARAMMWFPDQQAAAVGNRM